METSTPSEASQDQRASKSACTATVALASAVPETARRARGRRARETREEADEDDDARRVAARAPDDRDEDDAAGAEAAVDARRDDDMSMTRERVERVAIRRSRGEVGLARRPLWKAIHPIVVYRFVGSADRLRPLAEWRRSHATDLSYFQVGFQSMKNAYLDT